MFVRLTVCAAVAASIDGCGPDYSPNTYATNAAQQANKVDQGVIVGVREVGISASGTAGAAVGGAAGGIAGAGLDEHLDVLVLLQRLDHVRDQRDPALPIGGLFRHSNLHAARKIMGSSQARASTPATASR